MFYNTAFRDGLSGRDPNEVIENIVKLSNKYARMPGLEMAVKFELAEVSTFVPDPDALSWNADDPMFYKNPAMSKHTSMKKHIHNFAFLAGHYVEGKNW